MDLLGEIKKTGGNIPQKGVGSRSLGSPFIEGADGWEAHESSEFPKDSGNGRTGSGVS